MVDVLKSLTKSLHEACELNDDSLKANILVKIAQVYYNKGNFQMARGHLKQVFQISSEYPNVNYYLGLCELNLGNDFEAKKFLKKELKVNPKNEFARDILDKFRIASNFPAVTLSIFFLSLVVFLSTLNSLSFDILLRFGVSSFNLSIFSLVSSLFFHANIWHFLLNSIFLLMFGLYFEKFVGSWFFLLIFLVSGIFGNLMQVLLGFQGFVIGMSAGVFGIFGAVVLREPLMSFRLFGFLRVPLILLFGLVFGAFGMFEMFGLIGIGEIAHVFGFLIAMLIMVLFNLDLIFVFYNWIFIMVGFLLMIFSFSFILNYFSFLIFLFSSFGFIFGCLVILYSYYQLKRNLGFLENEVIK